VQWTRPVVTEVDLCGARPWAAPWVMCTHVTSVRTGC